MKINLKMSLMLMGLLSFLSYSDSSLFAHREGGFERGGGYDRGRGYDDNRWRRGEQDAYWNGVNTGAGYSNPDVIIQNEPENYSAPTETYQYDPYNAPNNRYEPSGVTDPYYQDDDSAEQE